MQAHQTLVLGPDYRPADVVSWMDAVSMWWTGKCEVVKEYDEEVRSTYLVIKVPAVVRLYRAIKRDKKPVKFSRVNVYGRDEYRCQYCGIQKKIGELTYDHVLPRSQGGKTEWTNIVSCCFECNARKGGRTPQQAKMQLRKKPVQPTSVPVIVVRLSRESAPAAWRDFMWWTGELEQ